MNPLTLDQLIARLTALRTNDTIGALPLRYDDGIEETQITAADLGKSRIGNPEIILS
jgi:hypothetical protein